MIDQRENILSRLTVACGAVDGVASAARNRLDVATLARPAIVILDGHEQLVDTPLAARGQVTSGVQRMELAPQIAVHIRANNAVDAGALLSLYRTRIVAAVLSDTTLAGYLGTNGRMRYEGATVAPPAPEGNEHRIDLMLVFTYVLRLEDLTL
jgi:hypothetical protein